jgi:hypothetical protein
MNRIHLGVLLFCFGALGACDNVARSYPTCPPGVSPEDFDCIPVTAVGEDTGGVDVGTVEPDAPIFTDASSGDLGICIPDCTERECGGDGCGGACGTCNPGSACSAGECVARGGGGDWDCAEIIECGQRCETERCWQQCMEEGTPEAQEEFLEILSCFEDECGRFDEDSERYAQCQQEQCGDVINACYGGPVGADDLTCAEAIECMFGCETEECQQDCFFETTEVGREQLQDFFECSGGECQEVGSVDEWLDCTQDMCPEEFAMCFEREPPLPPSDGCSGRDFRILEEIGDEFGFIVVECGFSCAEREDEVDCASQCMGDTLDVGEGCSDCLGEFAICIANECGEICGDPNSPECEDCSESICEESFVACAEGS